MLSCRTKPCPLDLRTCGLYLSLDGGQGESDASSLGDQLLGPVIRTEAVVFGACARCQGSGGRLGVVFKPCITALPYRDLNPTITPTVLVLTTGVQS